MKTRRIVGLPIAVVLAIALLSLGAVAGSGRLPWATYQELLRWETSGPFGPFATEETVELVLLLDGPLIPERIAELQAAGLDVAAAVGETVVVKAPVSKLALLRPDSEQLPWMRMALEPIPSMAASGGNCYAVETNHVLSTVGGDRLHDLGYRGKGVRIGVIDAGFTGDLAEQLGTERVQYFQVAYRGGEDSGETGSPYFAPGFNDGEHGTACAQAIALIAPEAEFFLLSAPRSVDRQAIWQLLLNEELLLDGAAVELDVLSDSTFTHIPFDFNDGRGELARLADQVVQEKGIFYAYAVGNFGLGEDTDRTFYASTFEDKDHNNLHDFTPQAQGAIDRNSLEINIDVEEGDTGSLVLALTWDGWPWILEEQGLPQQDLDLALYRVLPTGELEFVERSDFGQCLYPGMPPIEAMGIEIDSTGTYKVAVQNASQESYCAVERPSAFHLYVYADNASLTAQHHTVGGSLINLGGAQSVVSVGAVCWDRLFEWKHFPPSSQGPTTDTGGRTKPDLVAPTGFIIPALDEPFGGTSASAPLVVGMAALLRQVYPDAGPGTLRECLIQTAEDYGEPGDDNVYGYGLANVWAAYQCLRARY